MKQYTVKLMCAIVAFILVGCSATKITGSWGRSDLNKDYKKVAILALTPKVTNRALTEVEVMNKLVEAGITATHTMDIFPMATNHDLTDKLSEEEIQKIIKEKLDKNGVDAFMIIALLDREKEEKYVQGSYVGVSHPYGYGYRGSYYGYYGYAYGAAYSPGYYTTTTSYFIESNLYDLETSQMIWTAQTKTTDPSNLEYEVKNFSRIIVDDIVKKSVLKTVAD